VQHVRQDTLIPVAHQSTLAPHWFPGHGSVNPSLNFSTGALAAPTAQANLLADAADMVLRQEIAPLLDGERAIRLLGVALSGLSPANGAAGIIRQVRAGYGLVQPSLWDRLAG
jgi:hypothetical protein